MGFGVNTVTVGLTSSARIALMQMYCVLLCVELVTHGIVRYLLKRQLSAFRGLVQTQSSIQQIPQNRSDSSSGPPRRMSIMVKSVQWDVNSHNEKYWDTRFWYFMSMTAFTV